MADSALRRPLLWLLIVYMAVLVLLRARGRFTPEVAVEDRWLHRWTAAVTLVARGPLREDRLGWKMEGEGLTAEGEPFPYRMQVRWRRGDEPDLLPGDRARVAGMLRRTRPRKNPGDFDEAQFLGDRGIAWVLEARATSLLERGPPSPRRWAEALHRSVRDKLRSLLPPDRARLAEGFMLGYKGALSPELTRAINDAGVIHLIVPSGAKVGLALALSRLGVPLGLTIVLAAGEESPYVRAFLAFVLAAIARAFGRESDSFQAVLCAAWLELLFHPRALFTAGFQMTYLAMLGICSYGPRLAHWKIALVVQAALWPVFAQLFGRGSVVGLLANLIAVPAYPFVTALGWLTCVLPVAPLLSLALAAFEKLCYWAAALPWAAVELSPWPWTSVAAYYLALLGLSRRSKLPLLLLAAAVRASAAPEPPLRVVFLKPPPLKAGPRRAALVTFEGKSTWLVGDAPPSLVAKACRVYGVEVGGKIPVSRGLRLCRGEVCFRFDPPAVLSPQSAIIAALPPSTAAEATTDGATVQIRRPR